MILAADSQALNWRPFEKENAEKYFGKMVHMYQGDIRNVPNEVDIVRWFPESENTTKAEYSKIMKSYENVKHLKHINDPSNFMNVHDKLSCFSKWKDAGLSIPNHVEILDLPRFETYIDYLKFPILVRLNNGVAGSGSIKCVNKEEAMQAAKTVLKWKNNDSSKYTRAFAIELIDTTHPDMPDYNVSYRIIVAGNNVVTGYARCSSKEDWVAITNKFDEHTNEVWFTHNKILHSFLKEQESEIVKAVHVLGLNHQGLDVIPDFRNNTYYFLEVQTTYDAGFINAGPYIPPYYNPYNTHLIKFIKDNEDRFKNELPLYYYYWLDKNLHFDKVYSNLKGFL